MADNIIKKIQVPTGTQYELGAKYDASGNVITSTYVPFSGGTMTGMLNFASTVHRDQYYASNVCHFFTSSTPVETVIYTTIKYQSSAHMPVVRIYGYAYGLQSPIELKIGFYIYGGNLGWAGVVSMGAWRPQIYLFKYTSDETEYVAIGLKGSCYFLGFQVDVQAPCIGTLGNTVGITG